MSTQWTTLYKYVSVKHLEDIIVKNRLKLNDGTEFNDPFELLVFNKRTRKHERIKGLHILCLTNSYRKKLMWSHYADSHKGICLTVKVPNHLVYPICYTSKRVFNDSNLDKILASNKVKYKKSLITPYKSLSDNKKTALIKDKKWAYEKEYRIIFDDEDQGLIVDKEGMWYMSVKITNIYLGSRFEENDEEIKSKIFKLCKDNNIPIKKMQLTENEYAIKVKK